MKKRKSAAPDPVKYQRPFLKYPGCKHQLLDRIFATLPGGDRLIEPFAGSCVVGLNAMKYGHVWANDINPDLIGLYDQVRNPEFVPLCRSLFTPERNCEGVYYTMRGQFNGGYLKAMDRAAFFVYFNRHCYNGLCRYNADGDFNVPFGSYDDPRFPCGEIMAFQKFAERATFTCLDWKAVMDQVVAGDVVYNDPPYIPLSDTGSFTAYSGGTFTLGDQVRLAEMSYAKSRSGITVVVSNSCTDKSREIYAKADRVVEASATRSISRNGESRGKVKELLFVFEGRK